MRNLIGTVNANFKIIEQGKTAVIGVRETDGLHVAWDYNFRGGEPNFYWGRYGSNEYVKKCYELKEAGQFSGESSI